MAIELPTSESVLKHIFRRSGNHLEDTPANRELLLSVANDPACRLEGDRHGNEWFGRLLVDGRQAWVQARGGIIVSGGINAFARKANAETGLKRR